MKKHIKTIFLLLLTVAMTLCPVACNGETPLTEKQVWLPYQMKNGSDGSITTYTYDDYGNKIKTTSSDALGNIEATWINEYDENNNILKTSLDTGNGEPFVQAIFTYDNDGNLIKKQEFTRNLSEVTENIFTFDYDEQNRQVLRSRNGVVIETYSYAEDGSYTVYSEFNPEEYTVYNAEGKIQERHRSSTNKTVYVYNENGICTEQITYSNNEVYFKIVNELDENGNVAKIKQVFPNGIEYVECEYEYKLYTIKIN